MPLRPRPNLTFAQDQDGAAILDPSAGTITTLNETGAFVWRGLQDGRSEGQMVTDLARVTGAEEPVVAEGVRAFLNEPRIAALLEE